MTMTTTKQKKRRLALGTLGAAPRAGAVECGSLWTPWARGRGWEMARWAREGWDMAEGVRRPA
jgi:hypothetical protein